MASQPSSSGNGKKQSRAKKRERVDSEKQVELLDSLQWNPSISEKDEAFSYLIGSNELEGGFLSLEEIDETEYGLQIPKPENVSEENTVKEKRKSKKRNISECKESSAMVAETQSEEELENEEKGKDREVKQKKKKRKNKKKEKSNLENETEENAPMDIINLRPCCMRSSYHMFDTCLITILIGLAYESGKDSNFECEEFVIQVVALDLQIRSRIL